jgi:hypothetical protein
MHGVEFFGVTVGLIAALFLLWRGQRALFCYAIAAWQVFVASFAMLPGGSSAPVWPWLTAAALTCAVAASYRLAPDRQYTVVSLITLSGLALAFTAMWGEFARGGIFGALFLSANAARRDLREKLHPAAIMRAPRAAQG